MVRLNFAFEFSLARARGFRGRAAATIGRPRPTHQLAQFIERFGPMQDKREHVPKSGAMTKDETRKILSDDIDNYRRKAIYYRSLHLFEAEKYANHLDSNIELALTTMPSDEDTEIS